MGLQTRGSPWSAQTRPCLPSLTVGGRLRTYEFSAEICSATINRQFRGKFLHCVRTACTLRTQRLGSSPKNTSHLSSSTAKQHSP